MRLDDWRTGKLSSRELNSLIRYLPRESALGVALHGESPWSRTDQLLAIIADRVAILDWHFVCANRGEDDDTPDFPELIPRPGVEQPENVLLPPSAPEEQVAFFSDL